MRTEDRPRHVEPPIRVAAIGAIWLSLMVCGKFLTGMQPLSREPLSHAESRFPPPLLYVVCAWLSRFAFDCAAICASPLRNARSSINVASKTATIHAV